MGEKPICVKCKHCDLVNGIYGCVNEDAPITDYVTGEKSARILNHQGQCTLFEEQK